LKEEGEKKKLPRLKASLLGDVVDEGVNVLHLRIARRREENGDAQEQCM
jgi:hypothetical protein